MFLYPRRDHFFFWKNSVFDPRTGWRKRQGMSLNRFALIRG